MTPPPTDQESATAVAPTAVTAIDHEAEEEKLKAIRDILVGDQFQGLNNRFRRLEKNVDAHYTKLGEALTTKFEALQVLSKSEIGELSDTVVEMVTQLQKEDAALSDEIESNEKRIADLEQRVSDMKDALAEQIRKMHKEFYKQMSEFSSLVKTQQEEVASNAVSRTEIAKMLNRLAGSLDPE